MTLRGRAVLILAALVGVAIPFASSATTPNLIHGLKLTRQGESAVVEIAGERAPNFTTFKQDAPRRVIVDVAECALGQVPADIQGDGSLVERITTAQYGEQPHGIARVIIGLSREAEYRVTTRGGSLFVVISPGAGGLLVSAGVPVAPERPARTEDLHLPMDVAPPPEADAEVAAGSGEAAPPPAAAAEPPPKAAEPEPEPVRVAMATPAEESKARAEEPRPAPAAEPAAAPAPREVAQEDDSGSDEGSGESGGEEVEEVEEVPEVPPEQPPEEAPPPPAAEEAPPPAAEEAPPPAAEEAPPPAAEEAPPPAAEEVPPPPTAEAVEEVPPPPSEVEERVEISGALKDMTWVGFQQTRESSRVFVKTNSPVKYRVVEEGDNLVVLELENAHIPLRNNRRFLDTHFFDSAVTLITPREIEGVSRNVRIEIQLRNRVPFTTGQEENLVYVNFQRAN